MESIFCGSAKQTLDAQTKQVRLGRGCRNVSTFLHPLPHGECGVWGRAPRIKKGVFYSSFLRGLSPSLTTSGIQPLHLYTGVFSN